MPRSLQSAWSFSPSYGCSRYHFREVDQQHLQERTRVNLVDEPLELRHAVGALCNSAYLTHQDSGISGGCSILSAAVYKEIYL